MSTEDNKALIRRAFEDLNQGNLSQAEEYITPNFVYHDAANPHVNTREEYIQFLNSILAAFAYRATIEDLIAEGDKVAVRFTLRGTHQGQWRGVPPTGKPVTVTATSTYRFTDGKVAELWQNADVFSQLQQMGLIPSQG
jgi:steroid delta-isomerase-like uncharacterized protein